MISLGKVFVFTVCPGGKIFLLRQKKFLAQGKVLDYHGIKRKMGVAREDKRKEPNAMSDIKLPELTLAPDMAAAAAMEAPALTLDPQTPATPATPAPAQEEPKVEPVVVDESLLSEEEKKAVEEFAAKIDVRDSNMVLQYGAAAQKNVASFSENALQNVRAKDMGEIGEDLSRLVVELKDFGPEEEKKGLASLFRRAGKSLESMKAQYSKVETNVDKICRQLEQHQITLLKDVARFDDLYEVNMTYFKELSMYILAGKKRLQVEKDVTLKALQEKAAASGLPEDAQAANDFAEQCVRFERKLHDLELTRMVAIQMAPQIRLVQNNDTMMAEKIQTVIMNTIPLWKSQMVIALGIEHSRQAMEAQRAVTDMTNELLKRNAAALHQATVDITRESERGIVDIETLTQTNAELIATLDDVAAIQAEGRERRAAAETELARIETELKNKLIGISK